MKVNYQSYSNPEQKLPYPKPNLVLLGSDNPTTWIVYNRLVEEFGPFPALIESAISRRVLFKNRIRKLGLLAAVSQVAFVGLIRPFLRYFAKQRINQICRLDGLECVEPMSTHITKIASANGEDCAKFLREAEAKVVIVNGTRILRPHILNSTSAIFLNTHQGITPEYRGAHGAYWALEQNDAANCGVTIHLVDEGIDTGNIVGQAKIIPSSEDNFSSYPFLQTATALPLLLTAVRNILGDKLETTPIQGLSRVWYHPGFFTYIFGRLRGIK